MPEQTHTTTLSPQTVDETVVERHGGTKMSVIHLKVG